MNNYLFQNYNSTEVSWDGENIPCLKLCKGDMVSDVVYKTAKEVCKIIDQLEELKDLKLGCLLEHCEKLDTNKSLVHILQLLLNNDCSLKDLLDELAEKINEANEINLSLDFKEVTQCLNISETEPKFSCNASIDEECLETNPFEDCECEPQEFINDCGESLEYDINDVLQFLIDKSCCESSYLEQINDRISGIEQDYSDVVSGISVYQEPIITPCFSTTGLIHSIATTRLATEICELQSNVGSETDVLNAIGSECIDQFQFAFNLLTDVDFGTNTIYTGVHSFYNGQLITFTKGSSLGYITGLTNNTDYYVIVVDDTHIQLSATSTLSAVSLGAIGGVSIPPPINYVYVKGLVLSSQNLAQTSKNQWVVLCNLLHRADTILNSTCCQPDCDEIKIGFQSTYIEDDNVYRLIFNKTYGNNIPDGWSDTGSILVIEDHLGIFYEYDLEITQTYTYDIDLEGLDITKPLSLSIKTSFAYEGSSLQCKSCNSYTLKAISLDTCSFCKICAEGSKPTDQVKVSYYTEDNTKVRSSILTPGTCLTFKQPEEKPTVTSIVVLTTGSDIEVGVDPSTDCSEDLVLPEPKGNTCWFFKMPSMSTDWFIQGVEYNPLAPIIASGLFVNQTSGDVLYKFGVRIDNDQMFYYSSLKTEENPTIALSGECGEFYYTGSQKGTDKQEGGVICKLPNFSTSSIVSSKKCGEIFYQRVNSLGAALGYDNPKTGLGLGLRGEVQLLNENDLAFDLNTGTGSGEDNAGMTRTVNGEFGILLTLQGQSPNVPPILTIVDSVTNTEIKIEGVYQDESCECQE